MNPVFSIFVRSRVLCSGRLAVFGLSAKYSAVETGCTSEGDLPDFSKTILAMSAQLAG